MPVEDLTTALLIALIGMGLVFGVIVLFWLFMMVLVQAVGSKEGTAAAAEEPAGQEPGTDERARRQKAAIAAVSVALAMKGQETPKAYPLPPTVVVNTWQAVMRARLLSGRREGGQ